MLAMQECGCCGSVCSTKETSESTFFEYPFSCATDTLDDDDFLQVLSSHCIPDPHVSLALSSSLSSFASFGSESSASLSSFSCNYVDDGHETPMHNDVSESTVTLEGSLRTLQSQKRVRFGGVTVREHAVTVGCHKNVTCPLELSWEFHQSHWPSHTSYYCSQFNSKQQSGVHRLSLNERREWIQRVQGVSMEDVKLMEQAILARLSRTESREYARNFAVDTGIRYIGDAQPRKPSKQL